MNCKKRLAKQWLWLICSLGAVLVAWSFFNSPHPMIRAGQLWGEILDFRIGGPLEARLLSIVLIGLVYFITIWARKEVRR